MKPILWAQAAALFGLLLAAPGMVLQAQPPDFTPPQSPKDVIIPTDASFLRSPSATFSDMISGNRTPRVRLFRMPTGFLSDPVGLDNDSGTPPLDVNNSFGSSHGGDSDGLNFLQLTVGNDNPFFDFRRPGDPGGVGYYRLNSQVQLLNTGSTGFSVGCQAVAPAGLESDGIADGPTFLSPNLAWFQDLGAGNALQGFVGKNVRANPRWSDGLNRGIEYGMAYQRPLANPNNDPSHGLFLFVEALGRYRPDGDPNARQINPLEVLPGVHWRVSDNWWLTGGLVLPVGVSNTNPNYWQITCSMQF